MSYVTTKILGKDTTLPVSIDTVFLNPCQEQYAGDGRKQMYMTGVSIVARQRGDGAGYDVVDINGADCKPVSYTTSFDAKLLRNEVKRVRAYEDRGSLGTTNGYAKNNIQTNRFVAQCPINTILTDMGVSAVDPFVPISRLSFRCQDLNSTTYGQQYFEPIITDDTGNAMPDAFFVGMDNVPVIDNLRCNDGDAPIGIYKSKVGAFLNSVAFFCKPFDFPMPSIAAAPPGPNPADIAAAEAAACEKAKADAILAQAAADDAAAKAATAEAQAAAADAAAKAAVDAATARVAEANAAARAATEQAAADRAAANAVAKAAADAADKAIAEANTKAATAEAKAAAAEAAAKEAAAAEAAAAKAAEATKTQMSSMGSGDGNTTIIVGAVLGLLLLGAIIGFVVYFVLKKKKEAAAKAANGGGNP
jgi:hypothetical protein